MFRLALVGLYDAAVIGAAIGDSTADLVWRLLQVFLATIFVALLAYYSLKMMGLARSRRMAGGNLSLIESIAVGQQSMVQLIKVGDEFIVIGVTKENVSLLCTLDETQVTVPEVGNIMPGNINFAKILGRFQENKGSENKELENKEQDEQR